MLLSPVPAVVLARLWPGLQHTQAPLAVVGLRHDVRPGGGDIYSSAGARPLIGGAQSHNVRQWRHGCQSTWQKPITCSFLPAEDYVERYAGHCQGLDTWQLRWKK